MKLTNKSSAVIILGGAISPLIVCILLYVLGYKANTTILAAGYIVFGLPIVLIIGWLLSLTAKKSKSPLKWSTLSYLAPALIINFVIITVALNA